MQSKKLIASAMALTLALGNAVGVAQELGFNGVENIKVSADYLEDSVSYQEIGENELKVTGFREIPEDGIITIPATIRGRTVTVIGESAFSSARENAEKIKNIVLPDTVKKIEKEAFAGYHGEKLVLPENLETIDERAFILSSALTEINIPAKVSSIGEEAFVDCQSLGKITVDEANTTYTSSDGVLFTKDRSSLIAYPTGKTNKVYKIPEVVKTIETGAIMYSKKLETVIFPLSLQTIKPFSFTYNNNLKKVVAPCDNVVVEGANFINGESTVYCNKNTKINEYISTLKNVKTDEIKNYTSPYNTFSVDNILYKNNDDSTVSVVGISAVPEKGSLTVPETVNGNIVTGVAKLAFASSGKEERELNKITLPDTITDIGEQAFAGFKGEEINLPDSVETIGSDAFIMCHNIKSINIPAKVSLINESAFSYCDKLESITVDEKNANFTAINGVLFSKDKTTLVSYPTNKSNSFYTVPKSVQTIQNGAFTYLNNLQGIELYEGVKNVEMFGITYNNKMTSVIVHGDDTEFHPANLSNNKDQVVYCNKDSKIRKMLENTNTKVEDLKKANTPYYTYEVDNVIYKNIDDNTTAVYSIDKVPEDGVVKIPSTVNGRIVTEISKSAFSTANKKARTIKNIILPDTITTIGEEAFAGYKGETLTLPDSVETIGNNAFILSSNIKTINIPSNVAVIEAEAFADCDKLENFEVSKNNKHFTTVDGVLFSKDMKTLVAFPTNKQVSNYTVPYGVENIASGAFMYLNNLEEITLPQTVKSIETFGLTYNTKMKKVTIYNDNIDITGANLSNSADEIIRCEYESNAYKYAQSIQKQTECIKHDFSNWKVIKEATATEEGILERNCACGEKETTSYKLEEKAKFLAARMQAVETDIITDTEIIDKDVDKEIEEDIIGKETEKESETIDTSDITSSEETDASTDTNSNVDEISDKTDGSSSSTDENSVKPVTKTAKIASATKIAVKTYTGKQIKPAVKVTSGKTVLKVGKDYTVAYGKNIIGKGTVTITGKGNYTGKIVKTFKIAPRKTIVKVSTGKKKFVVKIAKRAEATKYQIQYSTSKNFKNAKLVNTKDTKKTIKAQANKKYFIRVRVVNGSTAGQWSAIKAVKVKA